MIALNAALRRLTVCQLTRESRGNGSGLRPRVWLRLRAAAGATRPTVGFRGVRAVAALHEVGALARVPDHEIIAGSAEHLVVAGATDQRVVAVAPEQKIITRL